MKGESSVSKQLVKVTFVHTYDISAKLNYRNPHFSLRFLRIFDCLFFKSNVLSFNLNIFVII